jgi:hypothetical protein
MAGLSLRKPMPRFFFHVRASGGHLVDDNVGVDLPDRKAARAAGERTANQLEGRNQRLGDALGFARIEVTDDRGELVDVVQVASGES